jgi:hypothetical protein
VRVKEGGVATPKRVHHKPTEAGLAAKATVNRVGGSEVRIQGRDDRWGDSDTVSPGHDPFPPCDRKH